MDDKLYTLQRVAYELGITINAVSLNGEKLDRATLNDEGKVETDFGPVEIA